MKKIWLRLVKCQVNGATLARGRVIGMKVRLHGERDPTKMHMIKFFNENIKKL